jgi:tripartite-type tricarboxylate transporter receptor subunit TctC
VPTVAEAGVKGFDVSNWQGIVTQAKVSAAIVGKLHADITKTLALPATSEALLAQGLEPASSTPQEFAALIRSKIEKYRKLVAAARIVVD